MAACSAAMPQSFRVARPARDERRGQEPIPVVLVAGPATGPQPGDAGRRAGAALVVMPALGGSTAIGPPTSPNVRVRSPLPTADAPPSQANGRGAFGSSGFGGWRQGGTFPTSGIRVFSWPIPLTKPSASAAPASCVSAPRPIPRPSEELGEPAVRFEVAPDHHESYVSSAFATRSTSGRGKPSA